MLTPDSLDVMNRAAAVYLATIAGQTPRIRALVNLRRADLYPGPSAIAQTGDGTVYLTTAKSSDKVREIEIHAAVAVYYCLPERFLGVMIGGEAEILTDQTLKQALWSEDWRIYWPEGPSATDYVVVRIVPKEIRGWHGTTPLPALAL